MTIPLDEDWTKMSLFPLHSPLIQQTGCSINKLKIIQTRKV